MFSGLMDNLRFPNEALRHAFVLVGCLVTATPTANNLTVMAELNAGPQAKQALAATIFVMYCVAPFLLTAWIVGFVALGQHAQGDACTTTTTSTINMIRNATHDLCLCDCPP